MYVESTNVVKLKHTDSANKQVDWSDVSYKGINNL